MNRYAKLLFACVAVIAWIFYYYYYHHHTKLMRSDASTPSANSSSLLNHEAEYNLTVVTAYLKTSPCIIAHRPRSEATYFHWASFFAKVQNPLVIYSDSDEFLDLMKLNRKGLPTTFRKVSRDEIWFFKYTARVEALFRNDAAFPPFADRSVNLRCADYGLITHAKLEFLSQASRENIYQTPHLSWIDIGCYRQVTSCSSNVTLQVPHDFRPGHVAVTLTTGLQSSRWTFPIQDVMFRNIAWIGGGSMIAEPNTFIRFLLAYRAFFLCMLDKGMTNTEQGIIFGMNTAEGRELCPSDEPDVPIQEYFVKKQPYAMCDNKPVNMDSIFYLCYRMAPTYYVAGG